MVIGKVVGGHGKVVVGQGKVKGFPIQEHGGKSWKTVDMEYN